MILCRKKDAKSYHFGKGFIFGLPGGDIMSLSDGHEKMIGGGR